MQERGIPAGHAGTWGSRGFTPGAAVKPGRREKKEDKNQGARERRSGAREDGGAQRQAARHEGNVRETRQGKDRHDKKIKDDLESADTVDITERQQKNEEHICGEQGRDKLHK